jgi:hypothetical protein
MGEADDGVHRGAQFVAHVGQKALGPVGGFGGFLGDGQVGGAGGDEFFEVFRWRCSSASASLRSVMSRTVA